MTPFEQHPPHVRRKIALGITVVVASILVVMFVIKYTHPQPNTESDKGSVLKDFYTTILTKTQSYLNPK